MNAAVWHGQWEDKSLRALHMARRHVVTELPQSGRRSTEVAVIFAERNRGISIIAED